MKRILSTNEKNLVYNDLCMRTPYYPKLSVPDTHGEEGTDERVTCVLTDVNSYTGLIGTDFDDNINVEDIMAYLRPITDITDEELKEFVESVWTGGELTEINREKGTFTVKNFDYDFNEWYDTLWIDGLDRLLYDPIHSIHWLLKHHFDVFGLIPRGLALPATRHMYDVKQFKARWE